MEPAADLRGSRDAGRDHRRRPRHDLIPPARTEALRRAVPNLAFDRTIAGAGHNDIYRPTRLPRGDARGAARLLAPGRR